MTPAMEPARRLKLQFTLGMLLICAGGAVALLGGRWAGLALLAAGALIYFPASHRIKAARSEPARPPSLRNYWGAATALLIATVLSPLVLPQLEPRVTRNGVLPISLAVAVVLLGYLCWALIRRRRN